jgi:rod shape-determining protein MreD
VQGILTESPWLRLPLVLAVVLMLQTTLLAEVRPFGASVDLALLLAVCAGAAAGPVRGARAGLIIGFVLDLLLTKPILWHSFFTPITVLNIPPNVKKCYDLLNI